ncbi:hypothetical protein ACJX0J_031970, partial [Zea mays]
VGIAHQRGPFYPVGLPGTSGLSEEFHVFYRFINAMLLFHWGFYLPDIYLLFRTYNNLCLYYTVACCHAYYLFYFLGSFFRLFASDTYNHYIFFLKNKTN